MDTKFKYKIIMMQYYMDDNKKTTDKKQKDTDTKLNNINKSTENLTDKFDNPSPNKV